MFLRDDLTRRRHELGAELAAPCAVFEALASPSGPLDGCDESPGLVVARAVSMMHGIEDAKLRLPRGIQDLQHVRHAVVGFGDRLDAGPDLATLGNEVVIRIDHQKGSDVLVVSLSRHGIFSFEAEGLLQILSVVARRKIKLSSEQDNPFPI